jgi:hypothetical protein
MPDHELSKSSWNVASYSEWLDAWDKEVATIDPLVTERFFLMTGLLLPIWKSLDEARTRVFRLKTDDGKVLLGRRIEPQDMTTVAETLGLSQIKLNGKEIYGLVADKHKSYELNGGMSIRRSYVMGEYRIEVAGTLSEGLIEQLKSCGCLLRLSHGESGCLCQQRKTKQFL